MTLPVSSLTPPISLRLLSPRFAVCRLAPDAPVPAWAWQTGASLVSVTRTRAELSLVVPESAIPDAVERVEVEAGWRAFEVAGPLDFEIVGVLAHLTGALARANIPVFALSTFDTDYLLVREVHVPEAITAFNAAGCVCDREGI